jgi:hypothetical protein
MKLTEVIIAAALLSFLSPVFASAIRPIARVASEAKALSEETADARFIAESFRALTGPRKSPEDFASWQSLVVTLTGVAVSVERVREGVFCARWSGSAGPLQVTADFGGHQIFSNKGGSHVY